MRLTGVILISIIPVIIGFMRSKRAGDILRQLLLIQALIDEVSSLIRYRAMTLDEIMHNICESGRYSSLGFVNWCTQSGEFKTRIERFINENEQLYISSEQSRELAAFFGALGASDIIGQQEICEMYRRRFINYTDECREKTPQTQKLCCSLGVLGGMFCAVLII